MPNVTQIECYFKSADMAALCKKGPDIIIKFKATYMPDKSPTFEISADNFTKGAKVSKSAKSILGVDPPTGGCPTPCH